MHKFAKQIMECVKTKVEAMGIDNIEGQHLEELEKWTEIAKNIVCYDNAHLLAIRVVSFGYIYNQSCTRSKDNRLTKN